MSKKLIIINLPDGSTVKLWNLLKAAKDKRQTESFDVDYLDELVVQMKSSCPVVSRKATEALLFLNAAMAAEYEANFKPLADLGVQVTPEFKKKTYANRNSAQRCFVQNNQGAKDELTDLIDPDLTSTIGDLAEAYRERKRKLRKLGTSVASIHKPKVKAKDKVPQHVNPVKVYSPEELAKFQQYYLTKDKK